MPKGNEKEDCYYFYIRFHPGVFKILVRDMIKILNDDFNIKLRSGHPERFGMATIKSICNFKLKAGEREKNLQIVFYNTNNSLDLKVTGNPRHALEKFAELGFKNGAFYFMTEVFPEVIKRICAGNDLEASKEYWGNLAKEGYEQEMNKEKQAAKGAKNKKRSEECPL